MLYCGAKGTMTLDNPLQRERHAMPIGFISPLLKKSAFRL
jgi:hypothetical protein